MKDLNASGRVFVREGSLVKVCRKILKKRWFVLFNDALMYGRKDDSSPKVKFHRLINLNSSSSVKDIPDKPSSKNGFQVITSTKSFVVYADSPEEKKSWIESFQACVDELKEITEDEPSKEQEVAPVWVHDKVTNECMLCTSAFTVLKRRVLLHLLFTVLLFKHFFSFQDFTLCLKSMVTRSSIIAESVANWCVDRAQRTA